MINNTLIIDCQSLAYKYVFEMTNLSSKGTKTNVIYGFLKKLLDLAETYEPYIYIFCWDSRQSFRKVDFPEMGYKERPLDPSKAKVIENAREQFFLLRKEILPAMGFTNVFMQTGCEADDLIAHIVFNIPAEYVIVSGDQDLYQLLDKAKIHDVRSDKLFTEKDFRARYSDLDPSKWVEVKAIAGCSSDTVSGIPGVGEKSAVEWLAGTLKKGKYRDKIEDKANEELVNKCRKLVKLPYEPISITRIDVNPLYSLDFMDCFNKYNCGSFIKDFERWRAAFKLYPGRK